MYNPATIKSTSLPELSFSLFMSSSNTLKNWYRASFSMMIVHVWKESSCLCNRGSESVIRIYFSVCIDIPGVDIDSYLAEDSCSLEQPLENPLINTLSEVELEILFFDPDSWSSNPAEEGYLGFEFDSGILWLSKMELYPG